MPWISVSVWTHGSTVLMVSICAVQTIFLSMFPFGVASFVPVKRCYCCSGLSYERITVHLKVELVWVRLVHKMGASY